MYMGTNINIYEFNKENQINIDKINKNNNVLLHISNIINNNNKINFIFVYNQKYTSFSLYSLNSR